MSKNRHSEIVVRELIVLGHLQVCPDANQTLDSNKQSHSSIQTLQLYLSNEVEVVCKNPSVNLYNACLGIKKKKKKGGSSQLESVLPSRRMLNHWTS